MSSGPLRSQGDPARPAGRKLVPGISSSDEASEESLNLSEDKVRRSSWRREGDVFLSEVRQMNAIVSALLH